MLFKKGLWPKGELRKNLVWTAKAKALMLMAVGLHLLIIIGLFFLSPIAAVIAGLILLIAYCLLLTFAWFLLWPFDFILKWIIIARAKSKIQKLKSKLQIIGIAGSYGKTTMKQALKVVLEQKYQVEATPDSVNTPVGIARWVLNSVDTSAEIIIVEMGEHYKGDIAYLCKITPPDIAVVTGINEAHLERLGSLENTSATILEIAENLDFNKMLLLNADDAYVFEHKQALMNYRAQISFYGRRATELTGFEFSVKKFDQQRLGWEYELPAAHLKGFVPLLGEYALGLVVAVLQVAGYLKADVNLPAALEKLQPVEHRLQPIKSAGNILVIDDAYNGNLDGALEAAGVLSRFANRRKIYITPGLVETGEKTAEVHREIGKQLARVADVVILIKNSVTGFIADGIKGSQTQIMWFDTAVKAHQALPEILKPGDVVVFQNDWGDQYL